MTAPPTFNADSWAWRFASEEDANAAADDLKAHRTTVHADAWPGAHVLVVHADEPFSLPDDTHITDEGLYAHAPLDVVAAAKRHGGDYAAVGVGLDRLAASAQAGVAARTLDGTASVLADAPARVREGIARPHVFVLGATTNDGRAVVVGVPLPAEPTEQINGRPLYLIPWLNPLDCKYGTDGITRLMLPVAAWMQCDPCYVAPASFADLARDLARQWIAEKEGEA